MLPRTIILVQLMCTLAMTGVIWFVQIVHYPLFLRVAPVNFIAFESQHATRTGWVVGPLMCLELAASLALLVPAFRPEKISQSLAWTGASLTVVIWISTMFIQVPLHTRLAAGFDVKTISALVQTNWIRTAAWTLRAGLVLFWTSAMVPFSR